MKTRIFAVFALFFLIIAALGLGQGDDAYQRGYEAGYLAGYDAGRADSIPLPDPTASDLGFDIQWQEIESDTIAAVGYSAQEHILAVRFADSGRAYYYVRFPADRCKALLASDSPGAYYNDHIKGNYYSFRDDGSAVSVQPWD